MKLSDYRIANELTVSEMGRRLGVSHSTVIRVESQTLAPSRKLVARIVKVTCGQVTPNDLFITEEAESAA